MLKLHKKVVMVFGVFDGLHRGHHAFLGQAKKYGDELIVVVARDRAVLKLKGRRPRRNERTRLAYISKNVQVTRTVLGDTVQGRYGALRRLKPDLICLGYDQRALRRDLSWRMKKGILPHIPIKMLKPHRPSRYHTSLLRKRK